MFECGSFEVEMFLLFCLLAKKSSQVKFLLSTQIQNSGSLHPAQRRWVLRHAQRRYLYTRPPSPNDLVHLQAK